MGASALGLARLNWLPLVFGAGYGAAIRHAGHQAYDTSGVTKSSVQRVRCPKRRRTTIQLPCMR